MGSDIHLVGHSLGAHLVGKIGRSFKEASGKPVERITGEFNSQETQLRYQGWILLVLDGEMASWRLKKI